MYNSILILTLFLIYIDKKIEILRINQLSTIKIEAESKLLKKTWVKQVRVDDYLCKIQYYKFLE